MPKEQIRKRGRRKPKTDAPLEPEIAAPAPVAPPVHDEPSAAPLAGPSTGIHPARAAMLQGGPRLQQHSGDGQRAQYLPRSSGATEGSNGAATEGSDIPAEGAAQYGPRPVVEDPAFPFGELDPDVKAYFRNVEDQIKDWDGTSSVGEEREDRQIFLQSVLRELRSHELQASTDPETSIVLERLLPSMGDWGRRVIGDSFGEKWEPLLRHRFASHVVQSWIGLAGDTLAREARSEFPPQQASQKASEGILPTMTDLAKTLITSILPNLPELLVNPHASPPIRLLLLVLTPNKGLPSIGGEGGSNEGIRSKRSKKFRKGQGVQGKSFIDGSERGHEQPNGLEKGKGKEGAEVSVKREVPAELVDMRKVIRKELMERMSGVEWRSMGINAVGSAAVQLLLQMEYEDEEIEQADSLFDHISEGLITASLAQETPAAQPFLTSLVASQTGTRLYEAMLLYCPLHIFKLVWSTYFEGKIGKLAGHPYANFVVAKGISRLDEEGVRGVVQECRAVAGGRALIKSARTSVFQALVERAVELTAAEAEVVGLIRSALVLPEDQSDMFVPCLLALKTYPAYIALQNGEAVPNDDEEDAEKQNRDPTAEEQAAAAARQAAWANRRSAKPRDSELAPNMQGCLLLQALIGLTSGANEPVLESLFAQTPETLLQYSSSPIASHMLDAVLTSPQVAPKYRRRLLLRFSTHYRALACDRIGSRILDTIWDKAADGFMREKIAKELLPHATVLGNEPYGRFFVRKMELILLLRRPEEWKEKVIKLKHHFAHQQEAKNVPEAAATAPASGSAAAPTTAEADQEKPKKKRKTKETEGASAQDDQAAAEIDELFAAVDKPKKKKKRAE